MAEQSWKSILSRKGEGKSRMRTLGALSLALWAVSLVGALTFAWAHKRLGSEAAAPKVQGPAPDGHGAAHGSPEATPGKDSASDDPGLLTPPSRDEAAALRALAELHVSHGELEKAVAPLEKILRRPERDLSLLVLAADVFLGTGRYRQALETSRQALERDSGHGSMRVTSILARYRLGHVPRAFHEAREAVKAHPQDVELLTALGTMEVESGPQEPGYGASLQAALKLAPEHAPALYQLGRKHQLEGNYRDAELAFRKVLKKEPRHPKARGQLGLALFQRGREREARQEFEAALAMNPLDYNTWFNLGELHLGGAAREKAPGKIRTLRALAMEAYLKAIELNPAHAQAHFRAGVLLNGNGQYKEAIRHLESASRMDSRHAPTWLQLSLAYEMLKKPDRAKACLGKAYELDPFNKAILFKLKQFS
jgi:tetratricopeptide (TPR) repeat protein